MSIPAGRPIGKDDFDRILEEINGMGTDPAPILETWGIKASELEDFLWEGAQAGNAAYEAEPLAPFEVRLATSMMVGFFIGFKTAQEIAIRKEVET